MWTNNLTRFISPNQTAGNRSTVPGIFFANILSRIKRIEPMILVWWCFAVSVVCSSLSRYTTESSGLLYSVLMVAGSGGCAWLWYLSRTLFRDKQDWGLKEFSVVPIVIAIEAIDVLLTPVGSDTNITEFARVLSNAASVVCIATIVFFFKEVLHGFNKLITSERLFRMVFLTGFGVMIALAILWVLGAGGDSFAGQWQSALLNSCAIMALAGSRIAIQYRLLHPHSKVLRSKCYRAIPYDHSTSELLAERILKSINDEDLLTTTNLKVAEFADFIGEQEYKVSSCITNHLNYRNFNHLLNSRRIDRAKQILNDPNNCHLNIATIAFDCGYNSLGPFNRAFKQLTGMTPREFRRKDI